MAANMSDTAVSGLVTVRPLQTPDLDLMVRWKSQPHLRPFYVKTKPPDPEDTHRSYGNKCGDAGPTFGTIACVDGTPYGYLQWYLNRSWPEWGRETIGWSNGASIDYFIGETWALGRGLGSAMLRALVHAVMLRLTGPDRRLFIGHDSRNRRAIRCTQAAGFRPDGTFKEDGVAFDLFLHEG